MSYDKEYYDSHRKTLQKQQKRWRRANKKQEKERHKDWYQKNRNHVRNKRFQLKYGLTLDQVEHMFVQQNGKCSICEESFENPRHMHVDHDHSSGTIRELLCSNCNIVLGQSQENIQILLKAISYLEKWRSK